MHREGVLGGLMVDPLWPGPGSAAFEMLCTNHPIWREADYVEPEELMNAWFVEYTKISLEKALALRQSVLDEIEDKVEIVGGMLL